MLAASLQVSRLLVSALALAAAGCVAADDLGVGPSVLPVASAERIGPREVRLTVTFYNLGGRFARDYAAFIHFDRAQVGEGLYNLPAPGPRPLVMATTSSRWSPNETTVIAFPPVTIPATMKGEVFVRVGLYDAQGSGARLPLVGEDPGHRVLVGRIIPEGEGVVFVRCPPAPSHAVERIGVRPRAFVRPLPEEPAVRFGEIDLNAWRVEGVAGGSETAARTREALCWSEASLAVNYSGEGPASGFVLRPPNPLPVPEAAKAAHLWLLGNAVGWLEQRTDEEPLLRCSLEFRDGGGATHQLAFPTAVAYPYWYVARARLPQDWPRPLVYTGLSFLGCTNKTPRGLVLDALVFPREEFPTTLTTDVRLDDLPFPTTPDGPLPSQLAGPYTNRVERAQDGYRLTYEGADGRLTYRFQPRSGSLDDVEATWADTDGKAQQPFRLAAGSGPLAESGGRTFGPSPRGAERTCASAQVEGNAVVTAWRWQLPGGPVDYSLRLTIKGKSLIADLTSDSEALSGFSAGHFQGAGDARFIPFPYWSYGVWDYGRDGGVVLNEGLFISGFPDWYRSAASNVTFGPRLSHDPEALLASAVAYCPNAEYLPRSDGRRNPLRERFIFTVSPTVQETLPRIPHPPSPNAEKLGPYAHYTGGQASRLAEQMEGWQRLHAYGVDKVYIRHFDGMWADEPQGPQEWTLTEHAGPVAGDVAVKRYLDALTAMGFLPVLYTNYTDLQPVAADFDWDRIARTPEGDLSSACWPGSYPLKPLRAVELEARHAPRIAQRFGTQGSFCDVHTASAPWHKVDFDARLPGAGQFGTTYRCYAKLLLNERATYGAVYSEGSCHWLYAGLHDGSDAQIASPAPWREPFLVDFDLLMIHPKEMDAGMSWLSRYVNTPGATEELGGPEAAQDRFTAATLAFGHQATFTNLVFRGYRADIRTYYLIQPVQLLYAMRSAREILYRDPATGRMLSTSDALRSGAYRESHVQVAYDSGLTVRVNGSLKQSWKVSVEGADYDLPPSGFVCAGPGPVLSYSALVNGGRVDYSSAGPVRLVDARGRRQRVHEFETDGAAILRRTSEKAWGVWPLGDMALLQVDASELKLTPPLFVSSFDEAGMRLGRVEASVGNGLIKLPCDPSVFRFEISSEAGH